MFVIWRGWGLVVLPVGFLPFLATELIVKNIFGDNYYSTHFWTIGVASLLAAAALWMTGVGLEKYRDRTSRTAIDKATGEQFTLKSKDSFFFIAVKYWAFIVVAIGVFAVVSSR